MTPQQQAHLDKHACWLLGEIAMQKKAFGEAIAYAKRRCELDPQDIHANAALRKAKIYDRLSQSFGTPSQASEPDARSADYSAMVINLDRDAARFEKLRSRFSQSPVSLVRIPGVYGSYLPKVALQTLCRTAGSPGAGSAGCLLSHVKAWELMIAKNLDVCLILEDDAFPLVNLPHRFASLGIPKNFDICFVNARMAPVLPTSEEVLTAHPTVFRVIEALSSFPPQFNAPGADGYFISLSGAKKLIDFFQRDGFDGDVDWRLVKYSVAYSELNQLSPTSTTHKIIEQMKGYPPERLEAWSMYPALTAQDSSAISTRAYQNT